MGRLRTTGCGGLRIGECRLVAQSDKEAVVRKHFSKARLREVLEFRIESITREWGFEPVEANGTAQLKRYKDIDAYVAYGEREAYAQLVKELQ